MRDPGGGGHIVSPLNIFGFPTKMKMPFLLPFCKPTYEQMKILRNLVQTKNIWDAWAFAVNLVWFRVPTLRTSRPVHCIVPNSAPFLWSMTTCHWQEVSSSTLSTILKLGDARKRVSAVYSNASTRERGWPGVSIVLRLGCNIVQSLKLFNYGGGEYGVPKGWVGVVMMQTKGRVTLPKWMNFS